MTPLPGYRPAVSRRKVLALYQSWPAGPRLQGKRTVKLWTVRDMLMPRGGYPAWVITFPRTSPVNYGWGPPFKTHDCAWVAIYNLQARVWTEDFQNCPEKTTNYPNGHKKTAVVPTCDAGCTPANQPALDAAAGYAEKVAGAARSFTGVEIDDAANQVVVYLTHAPQSVIDQLNAAHPGIYVIHNDAPRTHQTLMRLENSFNFQILKPEGIQVFSVGPSVDGYLEVGVSSKLAEAQKKLDAVYGPNVVRVVKGSAAIATPRSSASSCSEAAASRRASRAASKGRHSSCCCGPPARSARPRPFSPRSPSHSQGRSSARRGSTK
jgi:hypothetical protein